MLAAEEFYETMSKASMVIAPYTNAVLDASLLNRPCRLIASKWEKDKLQVERFFGKRVFSIDSLEDAVKNTLENFEDSISNCSSFNSYHLSKGADSVSFLSKLISDICENNEIAFDEEWR